VTVAGRGCGQENRGRIERAATFALAVRARSAQFIHVADPDVRESPATTTTTATMMTMTTTMTTFNSHATTFGKRTRGRKKDDCPIYSDGDGDGDGDGDSDGVGDGVGDGDDGGGGSGGGGGGGGGGSGDNIVDDDDDDDDDNSRGILCTLTGSAASSHRSRLLLPRRMPCASEATNP